ncbi:MAG TPA: hypothetical protein VF980_04055 [Thermoanaerobaculia bacterium]
MATCVKTADKVLMIDRCFLQCHGRVLKNLIPAEKMDDVPQDERKAGAREVADKIIATLNQQG